MLRTRAPGMTLAKMPIYAWAVLIFGVMIILAFPAMIMVTFLLELERAFNWPLFDATRGGDPLLYQHLFWFFGHPDVYIIFMPRPGDGVDDDRHGGAEAAGRPRSWSCWR